MKKVIGYFEHFSPMYFQKENFLKPLVLSKILGCDCEYYYGFNNSKSQIPAEEQGVKMICYHAKKYGLKTLLSLGWVLTKSSRDEIYLYLTHITKWNILLSLYSKLINKRTKIWVDADVEPDLCQHMVETDMFEKSSKFGGLKKWINNLFFKNIDCFSVNTSQCYDMIRPLFEKKGWKCLACIPCGVDEENMNKIITVNPKEKRNEILSVSRFGSNQKNTEMLLEGLAKVDLKDWKVYLVGPITSDFSLLNENNAFLDYIDRFYSQHPQLKDKVFFTGPEFDAYKLNEYFNRAKIFIMTSRHEAFANVFSQARWFGCHIVSTDVGGAKDMSCAWKYGTVLQQESPEDLAVKLQSLIDRPESISYPPLEWCKGVSYQRLIKKDIMPFFRNNNEPN